MERLKRTTMECARAGSVGLGMFVAMVACMAGTSAAEGQRPPNIILIVADDLGWGDVGFNGRKEWETPNLDRLGRQGTIFRRCYTAAVVCAEPGRVLDGQVLDPLGRAPQR